jgi:threonine efflux protein
MQSAFVGLWSAGYFYVEASHTMLSTLLSIALLHWLVLVTPGTNVLLVSQLAASGRQRSALYAGFGISVVAVSWALLALLGIHALLIAAPQIRLALQIAGGIYLCCVAIRLWKSTDSSPTAPVSNLTSWAAFRLGSITNVLNPKSALFFGSVFATALPEQHSVNLQVAALLLVFANAFLWHSLLALAFSGASVQAFYARHRSTLTRVAGAVVGAFGLRLVVSAAEEIRAKLSTAIRQARTRDIPAVAEMFDFYRQFYKQQPDLPLAQLFIADRLNNCESVILIAESTSSGMLGFCQLYPSFCSVEAKPIYSLYDLFVLPVARKAGIGRLLLLAAEKKAAAEGKTRMDLTTARTNKAAQSLYESLNWERDEIFFAYSRQVTRS